ncbi:MAG: hypothetical protein ACPGVH_03390 [Chitinophagales bacterium]
MKRIHLFEIEDFSWFPHWMRTRLTRLINVMHRIIGTEKELTKLLKPLVEENESKLIVDLCSGSGGPMPDVVDNLIYKEDIEGLKLTLTDLYPDMSSAKKYQKLDYVSYYTKPVNATNVKESLRGLRTMICSFHHMKPFDAKAILQSAQDDNTPIFIYEISDNSAPIFLWWIAIPINFIMCLFITPFVKPLSWQQLVFTYLIPIIPLAFAWDGAVSNARTYTLSDLDELLEGLGSNKYKWEKGTVGDKIKKVYLIGKPI